MKDAGKVKPYDAWLAGLSSSAREAMEKPVSNPEPIEDGSFADWRSGLSQNSQDKISSLSAVERSPDDQIRPSDKSYGLIESENGEFLVVRLYKTAEAMARQIGKLEGGDVAVAAFYGVFLRISVGPNRYLMLPNGDEVITIPSGGKGVSKRIDLASVEFECQDDGFLGPPELANTTIVADKLSSLNGADDSEEEEEEP